MIMPHAVAAVLLAAQDAPPAPPVELPWPVALGFRVATLERERKVVDQVVLVPDSATYVAEIAQWTASTRWPVLFDEPRFAPSFIRAFKPARVIRRESVGAWPDARVDREAIVRAATVSKSSNPSAGVVLTSMQDPAWTAAVALAAGRCQPITFLDGDFGDEFATLDANRFTELRTRVDAAAEQVARRGVALAMRLKPSRSVVRLQFDARRCSRHNFDSMSADFRSPCARRNHSRRWIASRDTRMVCAGALRVGSSVRKIAARLSR